MDVLPGRIGDYVPLRYLALGTYSHVYEAYGPDRRKIALKVSQTSGDRHIELMFAQEFMLGARLKHDSWVHYYTHGIHGGTAYIAMELVEGGMFTCVHPVGERLPIGLVLRYAVQLGDALQHAHERGIIHRDLKPPNLLLSNTVLKISDLGLALDVFSDSFANQDGLGPSHFVAPEQLDGHAVYASDQYSLAANLYVWLTGRYVFHADTREETFNLHRFARPLALNDVPGCLYPETMNDVLQRALRKDPSERYASVMVFVDAFLNSIER